MFFLVFFCLAAKLREESPDMKNPRLIIYQVHIITGLILSLPKILPKVKQKLQLRDEFRGVLSIQNSLFLVTRYEKRDI
jgi:hypothetical protein